MLLAAVARQAKAQGSSPLPGVFGGIVRAVESATGTLELLTGVGHAVRVMRMGALPATRGRFLALPEADRLAVIAFLKTL